MEEDTLPISYMNHSTTSFSSSWIICRTMGTYRPWITIDVISILGTSHPFPEHPQKFFTKYDPCDGALPKYHIKKFMIALNLMNVEHEDVVCRLFPHTIEGKAKFFFFNLDPRSITSCKNLKRHLWHSLVMKKHQGYCS